MTVSTYLILNSEKIYLKIHKFLRPFERRKPKEEIFSTNAELKDHVIIIGADRTGKSLVKYFKRHGVEFVVIDFNPDVFTRLTADGHKVIFGDANETEVFDLAKPENALMVVSTVAESEVDTKIILELKRKNINIPSIFVSHSMSDAKRLYEVGATYVILPESLASEHLEHLLESSKDFGSFQKKGESHFKKLTS